ncbi:MAG: LOG family protein [Ignavibacteriales bacterium]|nr:LOG family protein [Ignavibacteriales bacterium]
MDQKKKIVTIFGSSKPDEGSKEYRTAYELGKLLAQAGYVICNGGYGGIMEATSRGAKEANGETIGITVETFSRIPNKYNDRVIHEKNLIARLLKLVETGDGFVILPGSTGTLLEFALVWEFMNKSQMQIKPVIVVGEFWKPVIETLQTELVFEGLENVTSFIKQAVDVDNCVNLLRSSFK